MCYRTVHLDDFLLLWGAAFGSITALHGVSPMSLRMDECDVSHSLLT